MNIILHADARHIPLADNSIDCVVTSPPYYGLRDYGVVGQIGLEPTTAEYISALVGVFREVRRVLRPDGTCWINIGDSYAATTKGSSGKGEKQITNAGTLLADRRWRVPDGLKPKDLIGIPWMLAFALRDSGWWLRQDIIWGKPNPMPESVKDRCTKAHEYVFLLTKSARYFWDADAIREPATDTGRVNGRDGRQEDKSARPPGSNPRTLKRLDYTETGRNKRSVWTLATQPTPDAHFATYPVELAETCILAGCPAGGTVLDPFAGAGTTGLAALKHGRQFVGLELNPEYIKISRTRGARHMPLLSA